MEWYTGLPIAVVLVFVYGSILTGLLEILFLYLYNFVNDTEVTREITSWKPWCVLTKIDSFIGVLSVMVVGIVLLISTMALFIRDRVAGDILIVGQGIIIFMVATYVALNLARYLVRMNKKISKIAEKL